MSLKTVEDYLQNEGISFTHTVHQKGFTAHQAAKAERIPDSEFAKSVVFRSEEHFLMAIVPADYDVDVAVLRGKLGVSSLRLATEGELATLFPDVEVGAMPPFGNLYGLPVYVDSHLESADTIAFNAGSHNDAIYMDYRDFAQARQSVCFFVFQP